MFTNSLLSKNNLGYFFKIVKHFSHSQSNKALSPIKSIMLRLHKNQPFNLLQMWNQLYRVDHKHRKDSYYNLCFQIKNFYLKELFSTRQFCLWFLQDLPYWKARIKSTNTIHHFFMYMWKYWLNPFSPFSTI